MAKIVLDPEAFKVLASDTRLAILKSLDERPKTVSELAREHDLNKATVFEHLQQLVKGDLIKKKDSEGRKWVYYALSWKGRSLLHPEQATFMVLFSLAALGSFGAIYQLGNWLKWWALGGDGDLQPTSDAAGAEIAEMQRDDGVPEASGAEGSIFDFATDPAFWIFVVLLAATAALLVAAVVVRRRGRQRGPALESLGAQTQVPLPAELKKPGRPHPGTPKSADEAPADGQR